MGFYIDCYDCKYVSEGRKNRPDVCKSEEAMEHFQPKSKILYCTDINTNHDCEFVRLKFSGLVKKFFSN